MVKTYFVVLPAMELQNRCVYFNRCCYTQDKFEVQMFANTIKRSWFDKQTILVFRDVLFCQIRYRDVLFCQIW